MFFRQKHIPKNPISEDDPPTVKSNLGFWDVTACSGLGARRVAARRTTISPHCLVCFICEEMGTFRLIRGGEWRLARRRDWAPDNELLPHAYLIQRLSATVTSSPPPHIPLADSLYAAQSKPLLHNIIWYTLRILSPTTIYIYIYIYI